MSLFDKLKDTKFKSLKYGDDSFGNGDSLEPIIQKPIRDDNPVGVQATPRAVAAENRSRIATLLDKTSRGVKFISTQKGLQLSNVRLEATSKINQKTRITPLMFYTKENTLSQIGENPETGTHFDRFGITPIMNDDLKYYNIVTNNNKNKFNRLTNLHKGLSVGLIQSNAVSNFKQTLRNTLNSIASGINAVTGIFNLFGGNQIVNNINNKVNQINKVAQPFLSPVIDQYLGGPNTQNGIGFTTIRRFDYTNDLAKTDNIRLLGTSKITERRNLIQGKLGASTKYSDAGGDVGTLFFESLEQEIKNSVYNITPTTAGGKNFQDIIKKNSKTTSTVKLYYGVPTITPITATYSFNKGIQGREFVSLNNKAANFKYFGSTGRFTNYDRDDSEIMSILFKLIDPFTGLLLHRIIFSAYISDFKINTDSTWNDISYIGRSENLYVYSKFKRTASFNFQIPCFNPIELREKHRALGALESSLAGKYNDKNKLGGIITYLYLGSYIKGEPGIINSISYSIPNESSWDIDEKLAHNINVSVNFTLIHNQLPTFNKDGGFYSGSIKNGANGFISSQKAYKSTGDIDTPPNSAFTPINTSGRAFSNLSNALIKSGLPKAIQTALPDRLTNIIQPLPFSR
jgi:hypothetical protein